MTFPIQLTESTPILPVLPAVERCRSDRCRRRAAPAAVHPFRQGDLDGLCGVYAVVNAAWTLCPELDRDDASRLFDILIETLAKRRGGVERAFRLGLNLPSVNCLLRAAARAIASEHHVALRSRPLVPTARRRTLDTAWRLLQESVGERSVAIIGLSGSREHWTVGRRVTNRQIALLDSDGMKTIARAHCTTRADDARVHLDVDQIVLVERNK